MSTRICEQNPLLPPIAIGNMEKFIHACKIIETLETDVRLPLSIVAEPRRGRGESVLFPNAACSYIRICLETVVYPVRQKNTRGDHVRAVLQCPIGTSRGVAGRAFDRSLFGNTRNYKMPIPMVEG